MMKVGEEYFLDMLVITQLKTVIIPCALENG